MTETTRAVRYDATRYPSAASCRDDALDALGAAGVDPATVEYRFVIAANFVRPSDGHRWTDAAHEWKGELRGRS